MPISRGSIYQLHPCLLDGKKQPWSAARFLWNEQPQFLFTVCWDGNETVLYSSFILTMMPLRETSSCAAGRWLRRLRWLGSHIIRMSCRFSWTRSHLDKKYIAFNLSNITKYWWGWWQRIVACVAIISLVRVCFREMVPHIKLHYTHQQRQPLELPTLL